MDKTTTQRWSRRRWIAEQYGSDLADVTEYQPSLRGAERRLPIFDNDGLCVVALPGDSVEKLERTLDGRAWKATPHWRDPSVTVYTQIGGAL